MPDFGSFEQQAARFAPYVTELREFIAAAGLPQGRPADLAPLVQRLDSDAGFREELHTRLDGINEREGGAMPITERLQVLAAAAAGRSLDPTAPEVQQPFRKLLRFVSTSASRNWNEMPTGDARSAARAEANAVAAEPLALEPLDAVPAQRPVADESGVVPGSGVEAAAAAAQQPVPQRHSMIQEALGAAMVARQMDEFAPAGDVAAAQASQTVAVPAPAVPAEPAANAAAAPAQAVVSGAATRDSGPGATTAATPPAAMPASAGAKAPASASGARVTYAKRPASGVPGRRRGISPALRTALLASGITAVIMTGPELWMWHRSNQEAARAAAATAQQAAAAQATQVAAVNNVPPAEQAAQADDDERVVAEGEGSADGSRPRAAAFSSKPPGTPATSLSQTPARSLGKPSPGTPLNNRPAPIVRSYPQQAQAPQSVVQPAPTDQFSARTVYPPPPAQQQAAPAPVQPQPQNLRSAAEAANPAPRPAARNADSAIAGDLPPRGAGPLADPPPYVDVSSTMASSLVSAPMPPYPVFARVGHVEGTVVVEATVEPDGRVSSARAISGNHLLRSAAADAVKRWRYKPQTGEVTATVIFKFHEDETE